MVKKFSTSSHPPPSKILVRFLFGTKNNQLVMVFSAHLRVFFVALCVIIVTRSYAETEFGKDFFFLLFDFIFI